MMFGQMEVKSFVFNKASLNFRTSMFGIGLRATALVRAVQITERSPFGNRALFEVFIEGRYWHGEPLGRRRSPTLGHAS
jgi:hypothetical protein